MHTHTHTHDDRHYRHYSQQTRESAHSKFFLAYGVGYARCRVRALGHELCGFGIELGRICDVGRCVDMRFRVYAV